MTDEILLLHGLGVKKLGTPETIAGVTGLALEAVRAGLDRAVADGLAVGVKGNYMLTPAGRARLDAAYPQAFADVRRNDAFVAAWQKFELVNKELKALITDWQTVEIGGERIANDHRDADYDTRILDRLGAFHERVEPLLRVFAAQILRMSGYPDRLEAALEHAEDGAIEWVSGAKIESYHTVWFDLHEDLLRMLGRTREE